MIEVQRRTIIAKGRLIALVELDVLVDGVSRVFEEAVRPPGVRVIIDDRKRRQLVMSRERRFELNEVDLRLPGGKVLDSLDAFLSGYLERGHDCVEHVTVLSAAAREARQELGIDIGNAEIFRIEPAGATVVWTLYYVVAAPVRVGTQRLEAGESIAVARLDYERVIEACLQGDMREGRSAAVVMQYLHGSGHFRNAGCIS